MKPLVLNLLLALNVFLNMVGAYVTLRFLNNWFHPDIHIPSIVWIAINMCSGLLAFFLPFLPYFTIRLVEIPRKPGQNEKPRFIVVFGNTDKYEEKGAGAELVD